LVEEGFIVELKVIFTPVGVNATGKADARMIAVEDSGLVKDQEYPLGKLSAIADQGDLIPVKGKKKKNSTPEQPPPTKSLWKGDWAVKDSSEFEARAKAVASTCGGATLVGRVRSENLFGGKATISFQKWWETATPKARAVSLTLKKYRDELDEPMINSFKNLQCPFRGTAEFVVSANTVEAKPGPVKATASPNGKAKK
jgi:hypothetical protein